MAYDFPSNPIVGQEFVPPMGGQTYIWAPPRWLIKGVPPAVEGGGLGIEEAPINANTYGRSNATWVQIIGGLNWDNLPGKPATFPPSPHAHTQADVTGLTAALSAKETLISMGTTSQFWRGDKTWQSIPVQDWATLTGKPTTFAPSTHSHPQSEVTNLVTDLAGKAPISHTHTQAEVTGLVAAIATKEPVIVAGTTAQFWRGDKTWQSVPSEDWSTILNKPVTFPPSTHVHVVSDVTGLQTALDTKSAVGHTHDYTTLSNIPNSFTPVAHVHAQADVTGLITALAAKAPLASPSFTGTATFQAVSGGTIAGTTGTFSGEITGTQIITAKSLSTGSAELRLRGPANEDRMTIFTSGPSLSPTTLRVGGTSDFTFGTNGMFTASGGITATTGSFNGYISATGYITSATYITAGTSISTIDGNITANDNIVSTAGYFTTGGATVILGTATNTGGMIYLRPAGNNTSSYQTTIDGVNGDLSVTGSIYSSIGTFLGNNSMAIFSVKGTGGTIYLRPCGASSGVGQVSLNSSGALSILGAFSTSGNITYALNLISLNSTAAISATGTQNTIYLRGVNNTTTKQASYDYNGNFTIGNQGYKAVAGDWAAASDIRIKNVLGDYEVGLKELRQLRVKRYTYKGNETMFADPDAESPHYQESLDEEEFVSLVAQEAELIMPELVTQQEAWIDGEKVDDFRILNPTNVTWAMLNAIQELADRLEILETLEGIQHEHPTGTR